MKRALFLVLLYFLISAFPVQQVSAEDNDSIRISLLTCDPGEEIYSIFGHTAIRYENFTRGIDAVFNYGLFNFRAPNFILRFALGETDYELGITDYQRFASEYEFFDRSVYEQELNLSNKEKIKLIELLEKNYRPENRVYRYNFFFDNCATRPRDKIEECLQGKIVYSKEPADGARTFRDIIHQYSKDHLWDRFGMDFCVGRDADRPITQRQMMFAPFYLMEFFSNARVINGDQDKPLITDTRKIIDASLDNAQPWSPSPMQTMLLVLIITIIITIYGIKKKRALWGVDLILFALTGIAGCLLAFLAIFSEHPSVSSNYLLFVFHPGQLFFLPYIISCERKGKKCWYHLLNCLVLTLFIVLFPLIPQRIDLAIVPLALCLLIRSASSLILTYKKR